MTSVALDRVTVTFARGGYSVTPIDGLSFEAPAGTLTLLLGPSGCGKTTLLSCLAGILSPTSGSIRAGTTQVVGLSGAALTNYRRNEVGVVFQAFNLVPSLSATENVMVPMRAAKMPRAVARARAVELLTMVGLAERLDYRPGSLSGGQQQRVAIARALALDPPLILADEPTASLDHVQVETVLRILRQLTSQGRTIIVSTHDPRLLPLADHVVEMAAVGHPPVDAPIEVTLAKNEELFAQGSRGDRIFEVVSGQVLIVRVAPDSTEITLATVGPGDQFGEMGPVFGLPRSATARATETTVLTGYTVNDFRRRFGVERLMQMMARYAPAPADAAGPALAEFLR
jgi:putative ABC transport system ATP-binding protein